MSAGILADPLPVVLAALRADSGLAGIVGDRVYGEALPIQPAMDPLQPNLTSAALVVASVGGIAADYVPVSFPRLALRAYATSRASARSLWYQALALLHNRTLRGNGLTVNLALNAGPNVLVEPGTNWPFAEGFLTLSVVGG